MGNTIEPLLVQVHEHCWGSGYRPKSESKEATIIIYFDDETHVSFRYYKYIYDSSGEVIDNFNIIRMFLLYYKVKPYIIENIKKSADINKNEQYFIPLVDDVEWSIGRDEYYYKLFRYGAFIAKNDIKNERFDTEDYFFAKGCPKIVIDKYFERTKDEYKINKKGHTVDLYVNKIHMVRCYGFNDETRKTLRQYGCSDKIINEQLFKEESNGF